jgi:hypothetical protein
MPDLGMTPEEKQAINDLLEAELAEKAAKAAKVQASINKLIGFEFNGVMCSVTEADQNGWAAIKVLIDTILEAGGSFVPVPFKNENDNVVTLTTYENYIAFILAGAAKRAEFF